MFKRNFILSVLVGVLAADIVNGTKTLMRESHTDPTAQVEVTDTEGKPTEVYYPGQPRLALKEDCLKKKLDAYGSEAISMGRDLPTPLKQQGECCIRYLRSFIREVDGGREIAYLDENEMGVMYGDAQLFPFKDQKVSNAEFVWPVVAAHKGYIDRDALQQRWDRIFLVLDTNKDGFISGEDDLNGDNALTREDKILQEQHFSSVKK
ncbi:hypothetical protein HZB00_03800 [Candidatus Woesearchaeota archaeon]|nr:hypothetical protein [Candidatus Woesearchaeota archaeon]